MENCCPLVAADWDPQNDKKPSEVHPGSKYRAKFICQLDMFGRKCLHRWDARVASRCRLQKGRKKTAGCPAHAGKEVNNYDQRNALSKTHPQVAAELLDEKNPEHMRGDTVTAGCNEKLWWRCCKCDYEFEAQVSSRTQGPKGRRECEVCRNRVVHPDGRNSLSKTHPYVAEDWDQERNGDVTPDDVTAGSAKPYYWHCRQTNLETDEVCNYRRPRPQRIYSRTQMIRDGQSPYRPCEICNPGGGYKTHKPGYFYILKLMDSDGKKLAKKNGITNHPRLRMLRLSLSLWKYDSGLQYELEEIYFHYDGKRPDEVEKWAKKQKRQPKKKFDGGDELYEGNMFRKFEQQTNSPMDGWEDVTEDLIGELLDALERTEEE